jgi:hypothetical protein
MNSHLLRRKSQCTQLEHITIGERTVLPCQDVRSGRVALVGRFPGLNLG